MEFVAGISHELRTPVAVIKSAAENLSQGVVGNVNRVKRYGNMIESESRRLGGMVERVLRSTCDRIRIGDEFARAQLAPGGHHPGRDRQSMPLLAPDNVQPAPGHRP